MKKEQIQLSDWDKFTLEPFVAQFNGLEVHDAMAIQRILNLVEPTSSGLSNWKSSMIKVIEQGNEQRFKKLLDAAS